MIFHSIEEVKENIKNTLNNISECEKKYIDEQYNYFTQEYNKVVEMLTERNVNIYESYVLLEFLIENFNKFCLEIKRDIKIFMNGYEIDLMLNIHNVTLCKMDDVILYLDNIFYNVGFSYNLITCMIKRLKELNSSLEYKIEFGQNELDLVCKYE